MTPRAALAALFRAAVAAADPVPALARHLGPRPTGRVIVLGAGKAAAAMAAAVEDLWPGPLEGLVVTRHGHRVPTRTIRVVEGGHPVPDAAGAEAAGEILARAAGAKPDDHVLVLLSGGGSSLLAVPAPGLSLSDKQAANRALVASGAAIDEINTVRKHLSAIKGGRLAAACRGTMRALVVSDVAGDAPSVIASGPTLGDPTTYGDARDVLARHRIVLPPAAADRIARGEDETPKPGDPRLARARTEVIVRPRDALDAAAATARGFGWEVTDLGDRVGGEAAETGRAHARLAIAALDETDRRGRGAPPRLILSGGEVVVGAGGATGQGGPNKEYLLGLLLGLAEAGRADLPIHALAADSDGIDGSADDAGAFLSPDSLARARAAGLDPEAFLSAHDSHGFFTSLGDLLVTGPTRTNVNDIRAVLIGNPIP